MLNLLFYINLFFLLAIAKSFAVPAGVYVVNTKGKTVSLVDLSAQKEIKRLEVGPTPYGVAVANNGETLIVGVEGEEKVKFFDTKTFRQKGETKIGKMHNDHIILSPDGRYALVANFDSDDVVGIDLRTQKIAYRLKGLSAPHVVKYGPLKKKAYVTCKKVTGIGIIDPAARKVLASHALNVNPRSLTFSDDESKLYFGSFWVDGFFEMDAASGKVTRLFKLPTPEDNSAPQEVTYHGVEAVGGNIILAANEGRSYVDSVDVSTGKLLDRLSDVSKPCCIERIPGTQIKVLISNIHDGTLQVVGVSKEGKLKSLAKVSVGAGPKRVAFTEELPISAASE
jgi:DNA-binding beta-propeller fold protein YncE